MREVIRCPACRLNQYMTASGDCRRCHKALKPQEPEADTTIALQVPVEQPQQVKVYQAGTFDLATAVRLLRLRNRMSQGELARRIFRPRTWISKIETANATPKADSVLRLAFGLGVSAEHLMEVAESAAQYTGHC